MKVTEFTRRALAIRRENREMYRRGYSRVMTNWEIHRGFKVGKIIIDAQISVDGMYVYTLIGEKKQNPPAISHRREFV